MGGGDLNTKKSWHPSTLKNQERVWAAERAAEQERSRIAELQRERSGERERDELRALGRRAGTLPEPAGAGDKLAWMYNQPNKSGNTEDYLLGKAIDKSYEKLVAEERQSDKTAAPPKNHVEHEVIPFSIRNLRGGASSALDVPVDTARKLQEDPLAAIRRRELEARAELLQNPLRLQQLTRMLRVEQDQRKEKKAKKKSKKLKEELDQLLAQKLTILQDKKILASLLSDGKKKKKKKKKSHSDTDSSSSSCSEDEKPKKKKKKRKSDSQLEERSSRKKKPHVSNSESDEKRKKKRKDSSESEERSSSKKKNRNAHLEGDERFSRKKNKEESKSGKKKRKDSHSHTEEESSPKKKSKRKERSPTPKKSKSRRSESREIGSRKRRPEDKRRSRSSSPHAHKQAPPSRRRHSSSDSDTNRRQNNYGLVAADGRKLHTSSGHLESKKSTTVSKPKEEVWRRPQVERLSEEEKERRRREMMDAAAERDVERERNVARHREVSRREEAAAAGARFDTEFATRQAARAAGGSVQQRIRSNVYNIQRSDRHMDVNFAKR